MMELGTTKVGEVIAELKTRITDFSEIKYPTTLLLRKINQFINEIVSSGDLDADDYTIKWAIASSSADFVSLTGLTNYKLLRSISIITHNSDIPCANVTDSEFYVQKSYGTGSIYSQSVIWFRKGFDLQFWKGPYLTSYGQRYIHGFRLPMKAESVDSIIDLKDDKISLLIDKLMNMINKVPESTFNKSMSVKSGDKEEKARVKEK